MKLFSIIGVMLMLFLIAFSFAKTEKIESDVSLEAEMSLEMAQPDNPADALEINMEPSGFAIFYQGEYWRSTRTSIKKNDSEGTEISMPDGFNSQSTRRNPMLC